VKRFFITGATGFIGQYLLRAVFAFCGNSQLPDIKVLSRKSHFEYETVICDLQSEKIPDNALDGIDTVFHLAGFAHDLRDASKVENFYRKINVDATIRLTELAVLSGVKRFVFVSSVKAGVDLTEGIYGKTKREAELRLLEIAKHSSMHVSIIRPSLVYGPEAKGNLQLMLSAIKRGWFPPLPETGNRRSMIHVDDLVRAILLVAEDERANGEIFIATDGVEYSSCEIYKTMCQVLDKSVPNWSVPKFLFDLVGKLSPNFKYKVNKLMGDEYYSSEKLQSLGFKAQRSLREMNETEF